MNAVQKIRAELLFLLRLDAAGIVAFAVAAPAWALCVTPRFLWWVLLDLVHGRYRTKRATFAEYLDARIRAERVNRRYRKKRPPPPPRPADDRPTITG